MLNKRLHYQQHHFPFPPCFISDFQYSLPWEPPNCFFAVPLKQQSLNPQSLVACHHMGTPVTGLAALSPRQSPAVPPITPDGTALASSLRCSLPCTARASCYFCISISPASSVNLVQQVPEVTWTRTCLNPCFYHTGQQIFSSPLCSMLENHMQSFGYKFLSILTAIEKGDPKHSHVPGDDICFGNQPTTLRCRTWQVKPPRPACVGLYKIWRRHCGFIVIT